MEAVKCLDLSGPKSVTLALSLSTLSLQDRSTWLIRFVPLRSTTFARSYLDFAQCQIRIVMKLLSRGHVLESCNDCRACHGFASLHQMSEEKDQGKSVSCPASMLTFDKSATSNCQPVPIARLQTLIASSGMMLWTRQSHAGEIQSTRPTSVMAHAAPL